MLLDLNYAFTNKFAVNAALFNGVNEKLYNYKVWTLGFNTKLSDDFNLTAAYFQNTNKYAKAYNDDKNPDGWYANLWYKGADKAKVGSWGLNLNYRNIKPMAIDSNKMSGMFANSLVSPIDLYGVKGWGFQANYTLSKNAIMTATYETLNRNATGDTQKLKPFYYLQLNVWF